MIDAIRDLLASTTSLAIPPDQLSAESDLYEAGMSSFEAVTLIVAIEKRFGIRFQPESMRPEQFRSIAAIRDAVEGALAA